MEAQIAWDHFMAVSPRSCILQSWSRRIWVASYRLSSSDHFGPKQLLFVVNALAKAGIELGEHGSIFPRPKGKPHSHILRNS